MWFHPNQLSRVKYLKRICKYIYGTSEKNFLLQHRYLWVLPLHLLAAFEFAPSFRTFFVLRSVSTVSFLFFRPTLVHQRHHHSEIRHKMDNIKSVLCPWKSYFSVRNVIPGRSLVVMNYILESMFVFGLQVMPCWHHHKNVGQNRQNRRIGFEMSRCVAVWAQHNQTLFCITNSPLASSVAKVVQLGKENKITAKKVRTDPEGAEEEILCWIGGLV